MPVKSRLKAAGRRHGPRVAEVLANQACRALGGHVGVPPVACPVAVRLVKSLIETQTGRRISDPVRTTVPGKRTLINQTRRFGGLAKEFAESKDVRENILETIEALAPAPDAPARGAPMHREQDNLVQGMTRHTVHSFPRFFAFSDKFRDFLQDPSSFRERDRTGRPTSSGNENAPL